jgi:hypothetical protein
LKCQRRSDKKEVEFGEGEGIEDSDEDITPITTDGYLYLSGTPFRAIASGEFIEEQIFNWTYSDEQRAKRDWKGPNNPYAALPRMVLLTYQLPDAIREIAMQGEFNEFDLNVFFSAEGIGDKAKFRYEDEVQKWLDLIRGSFLPTTVVPLVHFTELCFQFLLEREIGFRPTRWVSRLSFGPLSTADHRAYCKSPFLLTYNPRLYDVAPICTLQECALHDTWPANSSPLFQPSRKR